MDPFQGRRWVIILIIFFMGMLFLVRLLYIQVLGDKWIVRANNITHSEKVIKPSRGLIYDRNGKLLVTASQVYDIWVTPREIRKIDTLELCKVLALTREEFDKKLLKARNYAPYKASLFLEGVPSEDYGRMVTKLNHYSGFETKINTQRGYPHDVGAHILGYIRKISGKQFKKDQSEEGENYYIMDDYIGITGLEKVYEKELRGERGSLGYLKDRLGNKKPRLKLNLLKKAATCTVQSIWICKLLENN